MSQILEIITAIGLVEIETATQRPIVFDVENAVSSVRKLPARVIFPVQLETNEGTTRASTLGNNPILTHTWTLYDLMLYHSASNTSNKLQFMPELVTYAANYRTGFKTNLKLGLRGVTVEKITTEWNDYIFPADSKNKYHGVLATLTVKEIEQ